MEGKSLSDQQGNYEGCFPEGEDEQENFSTRTANAPMTFFKKKKKDHFGKEEPSPHLSQLSHGFEICKR